MVVSNRCFMNRSGSTPRIRTNFDLFGNFWASLARSDYVACYEHEAVLFWEMYSTIFSFFGLSGHQEYSFFSMMEAAKRKAATKSQAQSRAKRKAIPRLVGGVVCVAGGGIGGLGAALALQRRGVEVKVFERDASLLARPQG